MCNLTAPGSAVTNADGNADANIQSSSISSTNLLRGALLSQVPDHPACHEALKLAQASLPPSIFNHSFRVFLFAQALLLAESAASAVVDDEIGVSPIQSSIQAIPVPPPHVVFVACILHDIGTAQSHDRAPLRFEVVGADVAAGILRAHAGHSADEQAIIREAWLAIALHDSPHVAERAGGLVRAVRLAVRADFGSFPPPPLLPLLESAAAGGLAEMLPRLEIEKDLGDAVVRQVLQRRDKAPWASWPGDLIRAKEADPEWEGVNKGF